MTISIIITFIASIARRRLIQKSLQFYRLRASTVFVLIGLSMLGVASIISFPHLYTLLTHQSRTNPLTTQSALHYLGYMMIIGIMIGIVVFYRTDNQVSKHQIIIIAILATIGVLLPQRGLYPLYYYLIAAGVEEYIKYYIGLGSFKLYGTTSSDIILFGMLSGLGFACIENIVYLVHMAQDTSLVTSNIMRRVAGPIVHMVYSGGLAYGYWYLYRHGWGVRGIIVSTIGIILIHTGYNSSLAQGGRIQAISMIVVGYMILSWMLYQCDRLYFETKNNLKMIQQ